MPIRWTLALTLALRLLFPPLSDAGEASPFGSDDQRGAANRLTPAKVLEAKNLIREGKVYQLGRVYEADMPLFGNRVFSLTIPGNPTGGPFGDNDLIYNDEMVTAPIGQVGTQFDGLGHVGHRKDGEDLYYNGFKGSEIVQSGGLTKLGVENVGVIFTRGVLLDIAATRGVERLEGGTVITVDDIEKTLAKEKVKIGEGDAVFFHTGHGKLWGVDNEKYNGSVPGIGVEAARWLASKKIVLTGADTWPTEVIPPENEKLAFPAHEVLLVENGIYNLENLDLSELAKDRVYEFAFVFSPLRLKGATGSPGNPIAVR